MAAFIIRDDRRMPLRTLRCVLDASKNFLIFQRFSLVVKKDYKKLQWYTQLLFSNHRSVAQFQRNKLVKVSNNL